MGDWQLGHVGFAKEASYGTAVTPLHFLPLASGGVERSHMMAQVNPLGLSGGTPLPGQKAASVQFVAEAQPDALGHLLTAVFGQPRTETVEVMLGWFRHTFEWRGNTPSYTVEVAEAGFGIRAAGVVLQGLDLATATGGLMGVAVGGAARTAVPGATAVASYSNAESPLWHQTTVALSGSAILTDIARFQVKFSAPRAAVPAVGATGLVSGMISAGGLGVVIGLSVFAPTSAWLSHAIEGTDLSLSMTAYGAYPTGLVGSFMLQVVVPRARVSGSPFIVNAKQQRIGEFTLAALASGPALQGVKVVLENATAAY
jgi:hypothetical protein